MKAAFNLLIAVVVATGFAGWFLIQPEAQAQAQHVGSWSITLEEPTGIYRRDNETVNVRLSFNPGEAFSDRLHLFSTDGHELPIQIVINEKHSDGSIKKAELLFQASIIPGERPEFHLISGESGKRPDIDNEVVAGRIGVGRFEMANSRFGVIANLGFENTEPALISAFNKTAAELKMLNLIDTSPDVKEDLPFGKKSAGFGTFLQSQNRKRSGAFDRIEILENGPFRARIKLTGAGYGNLPETWEFTWYAGSPVLTWKASLSGNAAGSNYGYFFSSISASPYEPFDRWIDGEETRFPDGWETNNPPDKKIAGNDFEDLPGNHLLYYQRKENYGALGVFELDKSLKWKGAGASQFHALKPVQSENESSSIAISFPYWKGTETVLEGRKEYRKFIQPVLSVVKPDDSYKTQSSQPANNNKSTSVTIGRPAEISQSHDDKLTDIDLSGKWLLKWAEKSEGEKSGYHRADYLTDATWKSVDVPGTVHTQILEAPKYHTKEADWISAKEWWYRRSFTPPVNPLNKRIFLKFEATDYYADVYLNGELLGRHEGYIDPYQFEVTGRLKPGSLNVIAVRVWTPVSYYWRHRPYTIKGSYGAVDQKPDNITPLGITRPVHLIASGDVKIDDLSIDTRLNSDGSADVITNLDLDNGGDEQDADISISLSPKNFDGDKAFLLRSSSRLASGKSSRRLVIHVEKPELWWTWDHGKPNLYSLAARIETDGRISDKRSLAVGIREIEHIDWKFYLNGKRMFIRGTNSYYNLFISEMRRSDYERDIELMRTMNINMIRLHCHFSNPDFYDIADEKGILIWQDFLEAWYPEDRAFSLKAAGLYDPHIRYVRNHPSIGLWATSDEESLENYRDLTKHLEPRLYLLDPQRRPVVRSTGRYGDAHVYEGWYGGTIWAYTKVNEKFISELGATALPNYESIIKFLPDHWPVKDHPDEWIFHKLQISEAMRAWGSPEGMTLKEYIPQTQDYVARLFQLAIERMRRTKYQPSGGILHFHAIDIWPSVTMAALDYYRQPTKAFYTVQRSFQMVVPSFEYDRDTWQAGDEIKTDLWVINDHWFPVPNVTINWQLLDSTGKIVQQGSIPDRLTLGADSSIKISKLNFSIKSTGKYNLWAKIVDERGRQISENNYEFMVRQATSDRSR